MKHTATLVIALLTILTVRAQQSTINLVMNPRPVASLVDWANRRDVLTLIVTPPPQGGARNVKINTVIKTADGTDVASTNMLLAPVKNLLQGSATIFYAADVVNLRAMVFAGSYQDKLNRTGKLPAGSYQIIVRLDSSDLPIPASNTQTKIFFLSTTQLPVLIMPANETVLPAAAAQTAITFRWTPVTPRPTEQVHYHVQVFEVLENQTAMQAFRSNQPLLDQEVIGTTQYIWRPMLSFTDGANHKFVWTVQSLDSKNEIITGEVTNGEGRSEPKIFSVSSAAANRLGKRNNGL